MKTSKPYLDDDDDDEYNPYFVPDFHLHSISSSHRDVTYRCGTCGFDLNLSSASRSTSSFGSKYMKSMKKGIISFSHIDETRFTQLKPLTPCFPFFMVFKCSCRFFRQKTKLFCRRCGTRIGDSYDEKNPSSSRHLLSDSSHLSTHVRRYDIRIEALQPGTPLVF